MDKVDAPLVITIRSSSQKELERTASTLDTGFDVGGVMAERLSGRLAFDPELADAGFKLLVAVGPAVITKLVDWVIETAKERRKRAREGDPVPTLLIEVNGQSVSIKGTAKPAALRAALEVALNAREA